MQRQAIDPLQAPSHCRLHAASQRPPSAAFRRRNLAAGRRLAAGASRRMRCNAAAAAEISSVQKAAAAGASAVQLEFSKYQGLGNDFILVDNRHQQEPIITPEQAARLCDRNFGVGGDGVIFALPPPSGSGTDYSMRIYNSDGSEPEMCGNGIRCLARFVADKDNAQPRTFKVDTLAGLIQPTLLPDGQVCVDMGEPVLDGASVPTTLAPTRDGGVVVQQALEAAGSTWQVTCVGMGNPHAIVYAGAGGPIKLAELDVATLGPHFESHPTFPARTNTEFVEVLSRSHVRMVVWERGAGRTLACGTGACALVVAGVLEGRIDRDCRVDLPGGPLQIEWREADNRVYMTGPGDAVFSGVAAC